MARPRKRQRELTLDDLGAAGDVGSLAHYADPAYYDKTYARRRHDVDFYRDLAVASGGPVLEYGVGSGRIAIEVARAGVEVTGIDLAQSMLDQLQQRLAQEPKEVRRRVRSRHGDMRQVRLRRRFPLVIAPFNAILHLYTRADMEAFLARVQAHLEPGGELVFDFSMPVPKELCLNPERSFGAGRVRDPRSGLLVKYSERFEYDDLRQILLCWMQFTPVSGEQPWSVPMTHRQFFPQEMEALLHYNGFTEQQWLSDFTGQPPTVDTDSIVVRCRPGRRRKR